MDRPVRVSLDFPRSGQRLDVFVAITVTMRPEDSDHNASSHQAVSSYSAVYDQTASLDSFVNAA